MKTTVIILSIALIACLTIIFWPYEPSKSEQENINQRDSLMLEVKRIQVQYDLKALHLSHLEAELVESRDKVKRSEQKLGELLKRERYAKIENKRLIERYSNYQLDSAFMAMYPVPDSIHR